MTSDKRSRRRSPAVGPAKPAKVAIAASVTEGCISSKPKLRILANDQGVLTRATDAPSNEVANYLFRAILLGDIGQVKRRNYPLFLSKVCKFPKTPKAAAVNAIAPLGRATSTFRDAALPDQNLGIGWRPRAAGFDTVGA